MKVIFDKDGTMFDNTHRKDMLPKGKAVDKVSGWTAFNRACADDVPIKSIVDLYHTLMPVFDVYIVTGAGDDSWNETKALLDKHNIIGYNALIMRPKDDHRRADNFKYDVFMQLGLTAGDLVIDDDPRVLEMVVNKFPGVNVLRVDSRCAAVINNVSSSIGMESGYGS